MKRRNLILIIFFHFSLLAPVSANSQEVTLPVFDGMMLELGNYVQNVRVRAKSLGTGFCSVEFKLSYSGSLGLLAPPLTWSYWSAIPHAFIGPSSTILRFSTNCDTGAIAEVKFFR